MPSHAQHSKDGRLFIVSGPSGCGKTTLCAAWLAQAPELRLSVSCTTRPPRTGEVNGREYYFLSPEDFDAQHRNGAFLECALVHGNWYGTRRADVETMLGEGHDVLLEIDWQGASQVAEQLPDACRIFILPPSLDVLRERLVARGLDDEAVIARRLAAARDEMAHAAEAHHRIVNNVFEDALAELLEIYRTARRR